MGRGFNKKFNSALTLLLLSSVAFGLEAEYKNTLTKVELTKTAENSYDINLHTQKKFQEPIRVIKKSDLNYYILLPETRNNTSQTAANIADIRNITTDSYPYAGADIDNGYTKININTTKPINFNINIKNSISDATIKADLKEKIANEEKSSEVVKPEKVQKKNSDFQEEKALSKKIKTIKKQAIGVKKVKRQESKVVSVPKEQKEVKEPKIEDLIREEIEYAIETNSIQGANNNQIQNEAFQSENITDEELEEIENIAKLKENTKACAKLGSFSKFSNLISRIENKLYDYGLSLKDAVFMFFAALATFFLVLFALNKKPSQTKLKSKADLIEKLDKQDNLVAKSQPKTPENNGQFFVFDKNVKQTGFCDPATSALKKNYELSTYEPDLRKNYRKPQVEQYQTKERYYKKASQNNEYDIIQKILKEDSLMDVPAQDCPPAHNLEQRTQVQTVSAPIVKTQTKVQEKQKTQIQEPTILSSVEIAPERGFMCVSYNDNINLMGYIFDDVFPIYNFKQTKLENYEIKFRLSEKDEKGANFIVKVDNTRLITRVTKNSMSLEVVM